MHEFSIVQSLMTLIEKNALENGAIKVCKVVVSVGALSGVEPHLLKIAFETFKEGTIASEAELEIKLEKLTLLCKECGAREEKEEPNAVCPACGSLDTEILSGEDIFLMSLELECPDSQLSGEGDGT